MSDEHVMYKQGLRDEIARLRGELLLISQLQAGDGSTINGLTKDQLGRAFRQAQDIARAALTGATVQPIAVRIPGEVLAGWPDPRNADPTDAAP